MIDLDYIKLRIKDCSNKLSIKKTAYPDIVKQLIEDGCCVIQNYLSAEDISTLKRLANEGFSEHALNISVESNGCDRRIYSVNSYIKEFALEGYTELPDVIAHEFYGKRPNWFQMLGSIAFKKNNLGSGSGWHRDSPYSHQFKFILYLVDVDDDNGPFEYIKGSHRSRVITEYSKFLGVAIGKYRFTDDEINRIEVAGIVEKRTTICAKAGTLLMANVRGLHRGKPLNSSSRLATTRYYFSDKIPQHFEVK